MNRIKNIVIIPLEGVSLDDKEIRLGCTVEELKAALGEPKFEHKNSLYYFGNELRVDFDADGRAEFIEFLGGTDGALQPTIYGVSAFKTGADELYGLLAEKNGGDIRDSENGYSYAFLNISVGVYRESLPEDVEEMIEEAEDEGEPMDAEDIAFERKKSRLLGDDRDRTRRLLRKLTGNTVYCVFAPGNYQIETKTEKHLTTVWVGIFFAKAQLNKAIRVIT